MMRQIVYGLAVALLAALAALGGVGAPGAAEPDGYVYPPGAEPMSQ